jgi:hypothetical protein
MTRTIPCRQFQAEVPWPRRALPCSVPASSCQTPPRVLFTRRICPKQRSSGAAAPIRISLARAAANRASESERAPACCMTWATSLQLGPALVNSSPRTIVAAHATGSLTRTRPHRLCPRRALAIVSFPWPYGSLWRMACLTKPPAGIGGATSAFSSPSPPSKTGWRPGGKKGGPAKVDRLPRLESG